EDGDRPRQRRQDQGAQRDLYRQPDEAHGERCARRRPRRRHDRQRRSKAERKALKVMRLTRLDHLVLTVASIEVSVGFYTRVLGMTEVVVGEGRHALAFGDQKLNLHQSGQEFEPRAARRTRGSADLCFVTDEDPMAIATWLDAQGVPVEQGPVERTGAL